MRLPSLHAFFVEGTDSRRRFYAAVRRRRIRRSIVIRKRNADDAAPPFEIPSDRGIRVFPPGHFSEADEIARAARTLVIDRLSHGAARSGSTLVRKGFLDPGELTLESPYLRLALRRDLLAAISRYLGAVPVLHSADVWYWSHHAGQFRDSELFHCDWDDLSLVKVFVYCTDVNPADGPLVVVPAASSEMVRRRLSYRYDRRRYRVSDGEMRATNDGEDREEPLTGRAGTVAAVDTGRCFHYGSRVAASGVPRIVAMFKYLVPAAFSIPIDLRQAAPFRRLLAPGMDALQRLVLGADE